MFLPNEVADQLRARKCASPTVAVRALGDVNGAAGEAHVIAAPPQLVVVSRRLGSDWQTTLHDLVEVTGLSVEGTAPELRLVWTVAESTYDVAIPSYSSGAAEELCALWLKGRQLAGKDLSVKAKEKLAPKVDPIPDELSPVLVLSASLQAMLQADDLVCEEELRLVERLIERPAMIEQGGALLRALGVDGLLARLGEGVLDEPQKQCLLANLYELAMVDGRLRSTEVTLLDKFRETLGVDRERCMTLEQVLRTKNDLSVFSY